MRPPHTEHVFAALKLQVYQRGVLLGVLTTAVLSLVWLVGKIPLQADDLIAPFMGIFCLASFLSFKVLGVRYLRIFEITAAVILFSYFLVDFALIVWRESQQPLIDFGVFLLWLPVLYIVSFLFFHSRRALHISLAYFGCILAVGIAYSLLRRNQPVIWHNVLLLTQIYASNLIYIATLYIIAWLKDRYGEAEIRSEQMKMLAMMDDLTGIHNRRKINDLLEIFIRNYRDHGTPFSIIMLDVDDLKRINDTFGHAAGDFALRRVAEILRQNVRESDQIGRWGGDEFFIFYPDTDYERVRILAKRLTAAVGLADFGQAGRVTLSLGLATCESQDTAESLWKRADEALYIAKREKNLST